MPDVILPFPEEGKTDKETIQNLIDVVIKLRKELEFLLNNLDEQNVLVAKRAQISDLLAGTIRADQIDVTEGKIQAAQIEELVVGGNVTMGPNATISWSQVTGTDQIPLRSDLTWDNIQGKPNNLLTQPQLEAALTNYVTTGEMTDALAYTLNLGNFNTIITKDYIASMNLVVGNEILMGANARIAWNNVDDKPPFSTVATSGSYNDLSDKPNIPVLPSYIQPDKIYSTYIDSSTVASPIIVGGTITGTYIYGSEFHGTTSESAFIKVGGTSNLGDFRFFRGGTSSPVYMIYDDLNIIEFMANASGGYPISFLGSTGTNTYPRGIWDFSGAAVTGLSVTAKFG